MDRNGEIARALVAAQAAADGIWFRLGENRDAIRPAMEDLIGNRDGAACLKDHDTMNLIITCVCAALNEVMCREAARQMEDDAV